VISAVVIGAGVSGLTSAVALQEHGVRVSIVARETPADTVSAVAAAMWYPLRGEHDRLTDARLATSYERFMHLASRPGTGIVLRRVRELFRSPMDDTWWRDRLPDFRRLPAPAGYHDAWESSPIPVIEMPVYLSWLLRRFRARGRIVNAAITSFDQLDADVVVNCGGLGAAALTGDPALTPVRGQVVRVEQVGIDQVVLDEQHPDGVTYNIPRTHDIVLGGTREPGAEGLACDPGIERAIIARCTGLVPELSGARVVSRAVGLRPGRPSVRLEREGRIIHNYGHAGSGVTLSWGCAREVVELVVGGGARGATLRS
jgi:D-amino-acid oxidase